MKRGAERQLAKDDTEEDLEDSNPGQGFRKADDSTLAARPIRGLPRRSMASTPTGSPVANGASNSDEPSTPKLGAFSGFGSPLAKSQSFTFTPPPTSPSSNPIPPSSQSFNLGFTSSSAPFSGSPFSTSSSTPTVAPSASSATKTFVSFLGPSASTSSGSSSEPVPPALPLFPSKSASDPAAETAAADTAASKYYAALRGINVAFLSALTQAVDEDPFVNIAEILDQYTTLRVSVQKDFDSATKPKPPPAPAAPSAAMPTPPTSFFGFGGSTPSPASSSTTSPLGVGFVPNIKAASSRPSPGGFTFPPTVATPASSKPSDDAGAPSKPTLESSGSSNAVSISLFGTGPTSKSAPSLFGSTQSNPFDLPKSDSNKNFTFGAPPKTDTSKVTTSLFGQPSSSSTSLFGSSSASTTSTASLVSSSNPFGAPSAGASKFGGFGGFGKPVGAGGSLGNPVGFGFGSPPTTPDLGSSSSTTDNFFARPKVEEKKAESGAEESSQESAAGEGGGGECPSDPSNLIASKNPHDEEGEGEEDEETVHAIKLKAYRLTKKDPKDGGGSAWSELGYGVLRVKTHKESGARRLLLRNSSTGKININFNLYTGLKPSLTKRTIMFVGHDQGASVTYNVRLQTEEQAKELKEVLDREIAFVKAKTGSDS
ncbi:hypothetical protein BDN71DRAFT_1500936 [Pleurotus eryngii]|uniref:RanBD1 domain-containing protein n=1 Tax=Pleurotus eryngii TaxID=5323 RepID=A0A9P6DCQ7_PLEER|nr:hypothetical protein BDN71DRAFT_1500936 [Pleurotus eryngii]